MRISAFILLVGCAACHKEREAPPVGPAPSAPVATGAPVVVSPPTAPSKLVIHCKSPDGKYRVDLDFAGDEVTPRAAHVAADGPPAGGSGGVSFGGGFPAPGELACSPSGNSAHTGCYVEGTADYGYIVYVELDPSGKRAVELLRNGVASTHLANLGCES